MKMGLPHLVPLSREKDLVEGNTYLPWTFKNKNPPIGRVQNHLETW